MSTTPKLVREIEPLPVLQARTKTTACGWRPTAGSARTK